MDNRCLASIIFFILSKKHDQLTAILANASQDLNFNPKLNLMFRFLKNKATNYKSMQLVRNLLEPLLGQKREFCKGAVSQKRFHLYEEENNMLHFKRVDLSQKLTLSLRFDDQGKCDYYCVWFSDGPSLMDSNFVDSELVRERGLLR